jgi:hypothetical protein
VVALENDLPREASDLGKEVARSATMDVGLRIPARPHATRNAPRY